MNDGRRVAGNSVYISSMSPELKPYLVASITQSSRNVLGRGGAVEGPASSISISSLA